jgi:hypothetical protein
MKIKNLLITVFSCLLITAAAYSQDVRLTETKIADLLTRLPANDAGTTNKLMGDMLALGEEGINRICDMVIPAGTGDDTKARFAVESLSMFLSQNKTGTGKEMWEKICISYATSQNDNGVRFLY